MDLRLLPLVFSVILTVASRLMHLYSTDDKIFRLKMKSFSKLRDTRRGTQSYMEKRRERREEGDRGDPEDKRRYQKGREKSSQ